MTAGSRCRTTATSPSGHYGRCVVRAKTQDPGDLPVDERAALRRLVERPLFELIPLRDALDRAESLPPGAGDDGDGVAEPRDRVDDRLWRG